MTATDSIAYDIGTFCAKHSIELDTIQGSIRLGTLLSKEDMTLFGKFYGLEPENFFDTIGKAERFCRILKQTERNEQTEQTQ